MFTSFLCSFINSGYNIHDLVFVLVDKRINIFIIKEPSEVNSTEVEST